jgi:hypothetical protein
MAMLRPPENMGVMLDILPGRHPREGSLLLWRATSGGRGSVSSAQGRFGLDGIAACADIFDLEVAWLAHTNPMGSRGNVPGRRTVDPLPNSAGARGASLMQPWAKPACAPA